MKTSEKVKYVLKTYPQTRDSDQSLIAMVWWAYNQSKILNHENESWIKLKDVQQLEKPASIIRCRQKLQEEGRYQAKKEIKEQREKFRDDMQHNISQSGWEYNEYLS